MAPGSLHAACFLNYAIHVETEVRGSSRNPSEAEIWLSRAANVILSKYWIKISEARPLKGVVSRGISAHSALLRAVVIFRFSLSLDVRLRGAQAEIIGFLR